MDVSEDVENVFAVHGTDQSTLVADVTDVTDVGDNKICGHSSERGMAGCLSGTSGGPPQRSGGSSVCHSLKLRSCC